MTNDNSILYVEDCEVSQELMQRSFNNSNTEIDIRLDIAPTISDALLKFNPNAHCAALIDWNLSDGCGIEVARFIRQTNHDLPLIFLSAILTNEHLSEVENIPYTTFFQKEYNELFVRRIINYLYPDIGNNRH